MTSYLPSVVTLALSRLFFYRHYDINGRKFIDIEDIGLFVTSGSHVATLTGGLDFQKGRNHWGDRGWVSGPPPPKKKKNWTDHPKFLMKSVITVT